MSKLRWILAGLRSPSINILDATVLLIYVICVYERYFGELAWIFMMTWVMFIGPAIRIPRADKDKP